MKSITKTLLTAALLLAGYSATQAQVKFKLSRLSANQYQVSLIPQQTLTSREAVVSTIQVSLKVSAEAGFSVADITSANPEVEWDKGGLLRSPGGATDSDYLFVGLRSIATRAFSFEQGKEVPLFTFRNGGDKPAAEIKLVDNENDPLARLPQNRYNIGNHISVLGLGMQNAWRGNVIDNELPASLLSLRQLYPNPASQTVTVEWDNYLNGITGEVKLGVSDAGSGRLRMQQTEIMQQGSNRATLNITSLNAGVYLVHLEREGKHVGNALKLVVVR